MFDLTKWKRSAIKIFIFSVLVINLFLITLTRYR